MDDLPADAAVNSRLSRNANYPPLDVATVLITGTGFVGVGWLVIRFVKGKLSDRKIKKTEQSTE